MHTLSHRQTQSQKHVSLSRPSPERIRHMESIQTAGESIPPACKMKLHPLIYTLSNIESPLHFLFDNHIIKTRINFWQFEITWPTVTPWHSTADMNLQSSWRCINDEALGRKQQTDMVIMSHAIRQTIVSCICYRKRFEHKPVTSPKPHGSKLRVRPVCVLWALCTCWVVSLEPRSKV